MSPSKRAGGTVDPDVDSSTDRSTNGNGASNGHDGNGNGDGDPASSKRRSTQVTSAAPAPERGTSSQRGTSSSVIAKPSSSADEPVESAVVAVPLPPATPADEPATTPDAVTVTAAAAAVVLPAPEPGVTGEPHEEPSADASQAVFDDEASSEPYGIPLAPDAADTDLDPLPLPVIVPAARGSQPSTLPEPAWIPAVPPESPLEPPYVTTSMTSHNVAPVPRVMGRRPRVRKVTRVVRHVDPWSIFKVALVFNLVLYGVLLTAGVLLWNVAYGTGTIDNLERFFESFGWSEFEFNGGAIYHSAWIAGLFGVIGLTGAAVLAATLFNLITDLVGGIRMTVLEEEVVERTASPMRRFVVRRPTSPPSAAPPETGVERAESVDTSVG